MSPDSPDRAAGAGVAPELLAIIVCPACHGELALAEKSGPPELVCQGCGLAYPVRDGIPVLLVDEARPTR
jgi:uncharacterized protein YbaR (Trm112 family)